MYADRVVAGSKRSVKERLNGDLEADFGRDRQINGKRQRQNDEKWKHDLYADDEEPQVSNPKVGAKDLRLKLQRKGSQQTYQSGKVSRAGVRDLREKLSGAVHSQPANTDLGKAVLEVIKPVKKSTPSVEALVPDTKKVANPTHRKKTQQKADNSVDGFLQSLGLEKYLITFQAEEVDMTALIHMTDEDLRALGIPMRGMGNLSSSCIMFCENLYGAFSGFLGWWFQGPRKKILLALDSRD
ncbi:uncharacterized protein LOC143848420 isoform X2 [Tasmannia lanceolata]|uniref:uncharacterized protein LOC143848420 isoform X2 n=1 Tax=Tasmannia lanceolata TaxID=3420 RepID=UPI0040635F55